MSEEITWTEDDIGEVVQISDNFGTTFEERIVQVFCPICFASFIGPIRHAGGFLAGHQTYHNWESEQAMTANRGLSV